MLLPYAYKGVVSLVFLMLGCLFRHQSRHGDQSNGADLIAHRGQSADFYYRHQFDLHIRGLAANIAVIGARRHRRSRRVAHQLSHARRMAKHRSTGANLEPFPAHDDLAVGPGRDA